MWSGHASAYGATGVAAVSRPRPITRSRPRPAGCASCGAFRRPHPEIGHALALHTTVRTQPDEAAGATPPSRDHPEARLALQAGRATTPIAQGEPAGAPSGFRRTGRSPGWLALFHRRDPRGTR